MSIRILDPPDPLSEASLAAVDTPSLLASSAASLLLTHEITRYCRREVNGRSFLISGHRGAGKTTLVADAFREVRRNSLRGLPLLHPTGQEWARPLLVMLHGPSLLPEPKPKAAGRRPPVVIRTADDADPDATEKSAPQTALEQVILCLHRAVVREVAREFRTAALDSSLEHREMAAQLEIELFEGPGPARLRELWRRSGFLGHGVLFRGRESRRADQGLRELVAVAGTCEAYRRISGRYKLEEKQKDEAARKLEAALGGSLGGRELFAPVLSLMTGALVGTGILGAGRGGVESTLAGLAAALGAAAVLKVSASRSRASSMTRETTFLFDLSPATLDRALPILIERLLAAGLAPIFVVDELDKVADLSKRMLTLVPYLKKLVAEHAFFCFLTDRAYFEQMSRRGEDQPYPEEYTYFTHRLFVTFEPADLHLYLGRVLEVPKPPAADPALAAPAPGSSEARLIEIEQEKAIAPDVADHALLPYVLLHRSQMHALDLVRRLAELRNDEGNLCLPMGTVTSGYAYRFDAMIQIAIEIILADPDVQNRLEREPEFNRLTLDSLYFLSRRWLANAAKEIDLGVEGLQDFKDYLGKRMGKERKGAAAANLGWAAAHDEDLKFLFERVRELAGMLADPALLAARLGPWNLARRRPIESSVQEALRLDMGDTLLVRELDANCFHWRYEPSGRVLIAPKPAEPVRRPPAAPAPETPEAFAAPGASAATVPPGAPAAGGEEQAAAVILDFESAAPAPEASAALTAQAPAAATSPTSAPAAGDEWRGAATFILDYARELSVLSPITKRQSSRFRGGAGNPAGPGLGPIPSPGKIDFTTLSSQLRLISTSPAWAIVQDALDRLRAVAGKPERYPSYDDDVRCIRDFAALLRRNDQTIADALVVAAVIGNLTGGKNRGDRILLGLDTLGRTCGFADRTEGEVASMLGELVGEVVSTLPTLGSALMDRQPGIYGVERAMDAIEEYGPTQSTLTVAIWQRVWDTWREDAYEFLGAAASESYVPMQMELYDLFAVAATAGPALWLKPDLRQMTISDWSAALVAALSNAPCPLWVGIVALHGLGFYSPLPGDVLAQTWQRLLPAKSAEPMGDLPPFGRQVKPLRSVLIVKAAQGSSVDRWRPSVETAAIAMTVDEVATDALRILFESLTLPPVSWVVVELAAASEAVVNEFLVRLERRIAGQTGSLPRFLHLYPARPLAIPKSPYVIAPKSLEDLVASIPIAESERDDSRSPSGSSASRRSRPPSRPKR